MQLSGERVTDVIGRLKHLEDVFRFRENTTYDDMTNDEIADLADDAIMELRRLWQAVQQQNAK